MTTLEMLVNSNKEFETNKLMDGQHLDADEIERFVVGVRKEYVIRVYRALRQCIPETMNPKKINKYVVMCVKSITAIYPGKTREVIDSAYSLAINTAIVDVESFKIACKKWLYEQFDKEDIGGKNERDNNGACTPNAWTSYAKQE